MSDLFKVPLTRILEVKSHPNADRLELATIYGYQVVIPKGVYKANDPVIYIPIDSILPAYLEALLFPSDSKIRLHHHRVRQIRIRGVASQGMIIGPEHLKLDMGTLELDYSSYFEITKYTPPEVPTSTRLGQKPNKRVTNPLFSKYTDIENIKWYPGIFKDTDYVIVTEKLHGTNARIGIVPTLADTWYKKLLRLLHILPEYEYVYGSHNVELYRSFKPGYKDDLYGRAFKRDDLWAKIDKGDILYGEIVGYGIQKGYSYGHNPIPKFYLFDIKFEGEYLCPVPNVAGVASVPQIYSGLYNSSLLDYRKGPSLLDSDTPIREGIVIRLDDNAIRVITKVINEDYLDNKDNTDYK